MDRLFWGRDRRKWTWVCLPDAGVRDVRDRLNSVMKGESAIPLVCLSVGRNGNSSVSSVELRRRPREALGRTRNFVESCWCEEFCLEGTRLRSGVLEQWH